MSRLTAGAALAGDVLLQTSRNRVLWIYLAISTALVVAVVAGTEIVPVGEGSWRLAFFFDAEAIPAQQGPAAVVHRGMVLAIFWSLLVWGAGLFGVGLGLLATQAAVPSVFAPGRAELVLARPLSRLEVVAARFAGAVAFGAIQIGWMCGLAVLLAGLKLGVWVPSFLGVAAALTLKFALLTALGAAAALLLRSQALGLATAGLCWLASWAVNLARLHLVARGDGDPALASAKPWIELAQSALPQIAHQDLLAGLACDQTPDVPFFDPTFTALQGVVWIALALAIASWAVSRRDV